MNTKLKEFLVSVAFVGLVAASSLVYSGCTKRDTERYDHATVTVTADDYARIS